MVARQKKKKTHSSKSTRKKAKHTKPHKKHKSTVQKRFSDFTEQPLFKVLLFIIALTLIFYLPILPANMLGFAGFLPGLALEEGTLVLDAQPTTFQLDGHAFTLAYTGFTRDGPIIELNGTALPRIGKDEGHQILPDLYFYIVNYDISSTTYEIGHRWHAPNCQGIDAGETASGLCCNGELIEKPNCMIEILHEPIQCGDYVLECQGTQLVNYEGTVPGDRIATRNVDGEWEFYHTGSGEQFVVRGNNIIRLREQINPWNDELITSHGVFLPEDYNSAEMDAVLADMESFGYNTVRVFVSFYQINDASGTGVNQALIANIADFLELAQQHDIYVFLTLPTLLPYNYYSFEQNYPWVNRQFFTQESIEDRKRFITDFITALKAENAPLERILAYGIVNELFTMEGNQNTGRIFWPYNVTGSVTTGQGVYTIPTQHDEMWADNLANFLDESVAEIKRHDSSALVTTGFFTTREFRNTPADVKIVLPAASFVANTQLDFLSLHTYPDTIHSFSDFATAFELPTNYDRPVIGGEIGVLKHNYPTIQQAEQEYTTLMENSCTYGYDGWLSWIWDESGTHEAWNMIEQDNYLNNVISPNAWTDVCADTCPAPYNTCEDFEECDGTWVNQATMCCDGICVHSFPTPTCTQQSGYICELDESCAQPFIPSSDSDRCCPETCTPPVIPTENEVAVPWLIRTATGNEFTLHFGEYGDTPVPGDYDGDGVTDVAVWRRYKEPEWNGHVSKWIIHQSSTDTVVEENFGDASELKRDVPVQADYDGDGITDMAYFRESNNVWTIKQSSNGQTVTRTWDPWDNGIDDFKYAWYNEWSQTSAVPSAADYDGDGLADLIAFRPYDARWRIQKSSDSTTIGQTFGKAGTNDGAWHIYDIGVPADYNGDGTAELAIRRPDENRFQVQGGENLIFGERMGKPAVGDYDGDGKADFAIVLKQPSLDFDIITDDVTAAGVEWTLRESSPQVMDDDGTYRMISCGNSLFYNMADAVWYAKSETSATSGFEEKRKIALGGCHSTFIKVPANINSRFSNDCGANNDVYLLYTESDSYNWRSDVDITMFDTPSSFDSQWKCRPRDVVNNVLRNLCDYPGAPACCNLPIMPREEYDGNKILLFYTCDPDASTEPWKRVGPVITLDDPVPPGSTHGDPYGEGHPNAQFLNGEVYITHYDNQNVPDGSTHLFKHTSVATSADGEHFTKHGRVQGTVGQENQYLPAADMFLGVGVAGGGIPLYFAKDLMNQEHWTLQEVWEHVKDEWDVPRTLDCGMSPGFLRNKYGIIEGEQPIVYVEQWNANNYCYPLDDGGDWSLNAGDPIATRINLDIQQSKCRGAMYRGCAGGVQERTCTATGWSAWGTCGGTS
ncbi:hypothetical protein GOV07_00510 [Candidatus Woesearchaeota archaeon]|nr:hypothetical protein [Candidatus Woesearchaeota archaeon]